MKKKQHYVWKHYLKSWSENGQIWCNRNGKIFKTSLENIGQQRFFYKAEKLNDFESSLVKGVIKTMHPTSHDLHIKTYEMYNMSAFGGEFMEKNGIEEYHTIMESAAIKTLDLLINKDLSWLKDEHTRALFSCFLGSQYTRTNRAITKMSDILNSVSKQFPEYVNLYDGMKISKALSLIIGNAVGNWINSDGLFFLIESDYNKNFITGDQPIFNIYTKSLHDKNTINAMKLFYPLSPKLGLVITDKEEEDDENDIFSTMKYNELTRKISLEQIYSNKPENLVN